MHHLIEQRALSVRVGLQDIPQKELEKLGLPGKYLDQFERIAEFFRGFVGRVFCDSGGELYSHTQPIIEKVALVGGDKELFLAAFELFPAVGDLFPLFIRVAVLSESLVAVVVGDPLFLHLQCGGTEELRLFWRDVVQDDGKPVAFEMSYLDGRFVIGFFQYLYTFCREVLLQRFFILFGQRDILYRGGIFIFETGITDLALFQARSLRDHMDEFPGTHVGLFYLEDQEVSRTAEVIKRYFLDKEPLDCLFKVEMDRLVGISVCFLHIKLYPTIMG